MRESGVVGNVLRIGAIALVMACSNEDEEASEGAAGGTTTEGEPICACVDDRPSCDPDVQPDAECNAEPPCCRHDGPYTCICPEAPPCVWMRDPC